MIELKKVFSHNLKGIDLSIPSGKLVVFTGVSGSGKSSLVFDTIYAEGQRRYLESLPHQLRRHLIELPKPQAGAISGLAPTVAVEQAGGMATPRSTVGTLTEIYDYLRVLFARVGIPHCPVSKEPISVQSRETMVAALQRLPEGEELIFLSPHARDKKGECREELAELMRRGFVRLRIDGSIVQLEDIEALDGTTTHTIELVVDRIVISPSAYQRLNEAVTSSLEYGHGFFIVYQTKTGIETSFSQFAYAPKSGISYGPLDPKDFSFNHPAGMCPSCHGLGGDCPACLGARIKPYPAETRLGGKKLAEITSLSLEDTLKFFKTLILSPLEQHIAEDLLREIKNRLLFLIQVGLSYLSLDRPSLSLSGGEAQRVRLAAQISSGLSGALYILDEPSKGLHPADHHKLIQTLLQLRDRGNSVLVVEHDRDTILAADWIVDMGPGAGTRGGQILAQGTQQDIIRAKKSLTGAYLSGRLALHPPKRQRKLGKKNLRVLGATHHNLRNIDVSIPLNGWICITGVSGSGKSSLIDEILVPALTNHLQGTKLPVGRHRTIEGMDHLDKVLFVNQSPIGRSPRSNAATYIKLFDEIRELFASLPESTFRGFHAGHFSFNTEEGRCPHCHGLGESFMQEASSECPECKGQRFHPQTLSIRYEGQTIHEVLEMDVDHCLGLFQTIPSICAKLTALQKVGLGYLPIGQPSTTLSGGEAQRIKLAKELSRPMSKNALYIFDEPTTGLHFHDIARLASVLQELGQQGATVLVIEHNMDLVQMADWVIDLGPLGGAEGGKIIGEGIPEYIATLNTPTGIQLANLFSNIPKHPEKSACSTSNSVPISCINVQNASQNNLKGVSISIPHHTICVVTGPSGSGKSSLAFDTIYAEGQRRYVDTLSMYARQAIKQLPRPKVDEIRGLPPSIAIDRKTGTFNPRSTVGTITEIYDDLRILYAQLGIAYCPETGEKITRIDKDFVATRILSLPQGERIQIAAPVKTLRGENFEQMVDRLGREGFLRIRLNGILYALDDPIPYESYRNNEILLVVDRLEVSPSAELRMLDAISRASDYSGGIVIVARKSGDLFFNLSFAVEKTGKSYPAITPKTFSFNAEEGMCLDCLGLGMIYGARLDEREEFLNRTAADLLDRLMEEPKARTLAQKLFKNLGIQLDLRLRELSTKQRHLIFWGSGEEHSLKKKNGLSLRDRKKITSPANGIPLRLLSWVGLNPLVERLAYGTDKTMAEAILPLLSPMICPACSGSRLNPLARSVLLQGISLPQLCSMSLCNMRDFFHTLKPKILEETVHRVIRRCNFLIELGLSYLSLDRAAPTLSGGERQRLQLARQLGSGLTSCLYILEEPTASLHPHDCQHLLSSLRSLKDLGNSLLIIEQDLSVMRQADFLIELGPGSGKEGGQIVAQGTVDQLMTNPKSLAGAYLARYADLSVPSTRRPFSPDIRVEQASLHNLKNISVAFPRGAISCVTGVSGSGKSTLLYDLLRPAAEKAISSRKKSKSMDYGGTIFWGLDAFDKLVSIEQNPFTQTARADVSTYSEIQSLLRAHFSSLPQAKAKGLQPRHFSSNQAQGMCRSCLGLGYRSVPLQFLPSVRVPCESCGGYRINSTAREIVYHGKHLGQILSLTAEETLALFAAFPTIARRLRMLIDVGLAYLPLNQELATLSTGEGQRLRLARELSKKEDGKTLYLIDEPMNGLHHDEIKKILSIFHRLADQGNTLILIEHHITVVAHADYIIDLGPGGGEAGGCVIAVGTPEEVSRNELSKTGQFLKRFFCKI